MKLFSPYQLGATDPATFYTPGAVGYSDYPASPAKGSL